MKILNIDFNPSSSKCSIKSGCCAEAIDYLSEKGYDPQFGARPVKRVIQRDVLNQLSKEILSGTITHDSIVLIDAFDGKLVFRNQSELVH